MLYLPGASLKKDYISLQHDIMIEWLPDHNVGVVKSGALKFLQQRQFPSNKLVSSKQTLRLLVFCFPAEPHHPFLEDGLFKKGRTSLAFWPVISWYSSFP